MSVSLAARFIPFAQRLAVATVLVFATLEGLSGHPKPANGVTTDSGLPACREPQAEQPAGPTRSPTASACEPYREAIELGLSKGRNAMAIWQDLVSEYGFASSYNSVKRFVRQWRGPRRLKPAR